MPHVCDTTRCHRCPDLIAAIKDGIRGHQRHPHGHGHVPKLEPERGSCMDPTQANPAQAVEHVATQIAAGGWPYLLTGAIALAILVIGLMWRTLQQTQKDLLTAEKEGRDRVTACKDQAIAREAEFAKQIVTITDQHRDVLERIEGMLGALRDRLGGPRT